MFNFTPVNFSLPAEVVARPVSHLAALTFLATSIYVAHEGLAALLPGTLSTAATALFIAVAVLQWLALGREAACLAQRDVDRAGAVISQAWMFGAIETVLYAAGGLALAREGGMQLAGWIPIAVAGVAAAVFAFANFRVKWVSCDPVGRPGAAPKASKPAPVSVEFAMLESEPADWSRDTTVLSFERALADRASLDAKDDAARATVTTSAARRIDLAAKRIRTRHWRAQQKDAKAAAA